MKLSRLQGWMRKYGNRGVVGSDGCPGIRHQWLQCRGPLLVFLLLALCAGGTWRLRPSHQQVKRVATLPPVERPVAPPLRPEWQPRSKEVRHRLGIAEESLFHYVSSPPRSSLEEDISKDEVDVENAAEEDFQKSLAAEVSGRVYADLGELHLRSSDYDGAVGYFMHALQIAPQVVSVQVGLRRVGTLRGLRSRFDPFCRPGRKSSVCCRFLCLGGRSGRYCRVKNNRRAIRKAIKRSVSCLKNARDGPFNRSGSLLSFLLSALISGYGL
ncbi:MAG: hypothetical protein JWN14_1377 [Chthonomonadales bacterium]|nr:hypothetical protein [Chthonomonadales bacterium]